MLIKISTIVDPWSHITEHAEGVVIQKDGILPRTFAFRPPDLAACTDYDVGMLSVRVNDSIMRLGDGWAYFFEAQRYCTMQYPGAVFDMLGPYLIDREREEAFRRFGEHFESSYYITFVYRPPSESVKKLLSMFVKSGDGVGGGSLEGSVRYFVEETDAVAGVIGSFMQIMPLDNEETVAYLHSSVSLNWIPLAYPSNYIFLDRILPDSDLETTLTYKLGENYIPIVAVNDFPMVSYPAILNALNYAGVQYRWVTRYICMSKESGLKEAERSERAHRGAQTTLLQAFLSHQSGEAPRQVKKGEIVKEDDAGQAGVEIDTDQASLGFYSSNVMVWDKELERAKAKADTIKAIINSARFSCKEETFNAFEAWKSMMPGNILANMRALPVLTTTVSHCLPLSSIWAGMQRNLFAGEITGVDVPHVICGTGEKTPFFLNVNPTDVGHTTVFGPTGAGKSTLLNLLIMQFFKYPKSQVIVFDKGKSSRLPCMACGGLYYEPASGGEGSVNFQPLRDLESDYDISFGIEFIETCLVLQGVTVTPAMSKAVSDTMKLMRDVPVGNRTITTFTQNCNYRDAETGRNTITDGLGPYCWNGKYGKIFDNDTTEISLDTRYLVVEMEYLMNLGEQATAAALIYLFYFVEKMFRYDRLTLLVLDEAWTFLRNEIFRDKIEEWLKTLRKKRVFCIFATQEVADVVKSPLRTTFLQQCLTQIFLADSKAMTAGMYDSYRAFGLEDSEIRKISRAGKWNYFYKCPVGGSICTRLFQLELGRLTLTLIGTPDHEMLDRMKRAHPEAGYEFCDEILREKGMEYGKYLKQD